MRMRLLDDMAQRVGARVSVGGGVGKRARGQKQGCGKPNRIYPKSYEAVSNTDFKKSGYGTPEN